MFRLFVACMLLSLAVGPAVSAQEAPKQITFGERRDMDPCVSPNGKQLAFASNRTGAFNVFLANLNDDKMGFFQLTQGKKDDRHPSWSADSKKIIFNSKRTGSNDLYEMAADGASGFLQLTDRKDIEEYPSYGSGGSRLLFASAPDKAIQLRPKMTVCLQEKGSVRPLAEGDEPRFSPNGNKIVFVSHRTKNNDIWVMNPDGSQQTQLTTDSKNDENPAFSPDGKWIVFSSDRTGNSDIWVMGADGANQRQLTTDPADETQPYWSAGGYLYYTRRASETSSHIFRIKAP